jgi:serine/threonine protein kinase
MFTRPEYSRKIKASRDWWVKIGDFGISKRADDGLAASSTLRGTLGFLAPELHGFISF